MTDIKADTNLEHRIQVLEKKFDTLNYKLDETKREIYNSGKQFSELKDKIGAVNTTMIIISSILIAVYLLVQFIRAFR